MISYPFGSSKLKDQSLNNYHRSRTIATKFAKALFTVSLSICLLVVPILGAMSRAEVQGQSSGTSTDQSTVNPISRAKGQGLIILYGTMENADTFVPPPPLLNLSQRGSDSRGAPSQFIVTYRGFTPEAQAAFQYAVDIWDSLIRSPVPIRIEATFENKGGYEDRSIILGSARPADRRESASLGVWVALALADKRVGRDLDRGEPDIITSFNSNSELGWYFGTDGNTPSRKQDFVSVVLHEIGHGLGFFSSATVYREPIEGIPPAYYPKRGRLRSGDPKLPEIYDIFVVVQKEGDITHITETDVYEDPSVSLKDAFESYRESKLLWNGEKGVEANSGIRPKLYAPDPWNRGSSYSHLDEKTFPAGDPNALMTPYQARAEASHHPGPITLGIFEDMGWTINKGPAFTDGSSTTRSVAENTGAGVNIDSPVAATDANSADPNANLRDSLTYTLSGIDAGSFAIEGATGQLKTLAALDYETKTAYTVTVTASDGRLFDEITATITVTDVDETPTNSPPAFTDGPSATRTVAEDTASGVNIGAPVAATDTDSGDTLTYTLGGADASAFDIISTTGQLRTKAALDYETKATHSVTVTVDDGSFTVSIAVTITVTDVDENRAPVFALENTTRTVAENAAAGVNINPSVAATDADNDSLTYTLSGTDASSFNIEAYGQLKTKAALDYEIKDTYTVTVTVSDGSLTDSITVTINITDVNEAAPVFTDGSTTTRSVAENTASGVDINPPVAAKDTDSRDTLTYTLSRTDAAAFEVDSTSGQLRTRADLDYETQESYTVTITVSDGSLTDTITVTINVSNVNEAAPVFDDGSRTTRSVAENTASGVNIGDPVTAKDADRSDTLTYTLSGADAAAFNIEYTSGQLRAKAALDYETQESYTVTITVSDGSLTDTITVTISVTDVPEVPANRAPVFTAGTSTTRSIAENTVAGVDIGPLVAATDADNDSLTYTLSGTDAAAFDIIRTTGQLKTKAALDYETQTAYTVTVAVSDGSLTDGISVRINVTDIGEAPTNIAPAFSDGASTTRSVPENTASGVDIEVPVAATDADSGDTLTYTLGGTDATSFDIEPMSGQLKTKAALDYETQTTYTVMATVSDGSLEAQIRVTINVSNVNDVAPTFTEGSTTTRLVEENTSPGGNIGSPLAATDADSGTTLTYALGGPDESSFNIARTSGQLRTQATLDYETRNSYTVTVTASDGSLTDSITVIIAVTDVAETPTNNAPTFTDGSSTIRSVPENTAADVNIGIPVVATDVDSGTTLIYTLGGPSASSFDIEPLSGQLQTKRALDYETRASYTVTVTVSDGSLTDEITVTITVTDVPESPTNSAPVFTAGSSTTRSIAENTRAGVNISTPVSATDADSGDTLTYSLGGPDASAFDIGRTSGQLRTRTALDYETKNTYTVTVTVTDGSLSDEITVTISVTDVAETPTNRGPVFTEGSSTTRSVAENTSAGLNIGAPVAATDADNDSLTYTLSGLDAASFAIARTSGQLKTLAALDYETRGSYTVTVTVSDGSLTDTISVTIAVTDQDDLRSPTVTLASQPLTEATLNGSMVTLRLRERKYEGWLSDPVTASGIPGVTVRPSDIDRVSDTELRAELTFDGTDFDTDATLTFTVKADAIANYNDSALTATAPVTAGTESVVASPAAPLTEATLNGSTVTLTLTGGVYESRYTVGNNVTVSGVAGVTVNRFNVARVSDTQVTVELIFDGTDFDTDAALTFTVEPDAVAGYNGAALIAQLPVIPVVEENPTVTASTPQPLTEPTLNQSLVTLTLNSGVYVQSRADISRAVQVDGIPGVTFSRFNVARISDTQVTVQLTFDDTDFDTDATLTFTVGADAIANYNGPALITPIPVTAVIEERPTITVLTPQPFTEATLDGIILLTLNNGTYVRSTYDIKNAITVSGIVGITVGRYVRRESDTQIAVELDFNGNIDTDAALTFTVGAGAIARYDGPALIVQVSVTGGTESVAASTAAALTESTLHGSVVTLTLNGATYERSTFDLRDAVEISGIDGVTYHWFDLDRVSDTALTVELKFNGNIDTDATLKFTVGADAIAGYNGPALITTLPVTAGQELIVASTEAPLTESTLDGSVVTLTLTGGVYEDLWSSTKDVTVSGIDGVTVASWGVDRISDTVITVELDFEGNFDTDATLTLTVEADALVGYNGPALIATLPVTGSKESVVASTDAPLTESTLDESVVTLTLTGGVYEDLWSSTRDVTVSGIDGVTVASWGVDRISDTVITVELDFEGNFDTDATLTLTVEADALVGYNGPALITTLPVTGSKESIVASTDAPLTESTLDESVVTLTLTGGVYEDLWSSTRDVTVSGIDGVTVASWGVDRISDTVITVELAFEGNIDTDVTLTLAVESGALVGYNGPALIATLPVTGGKESVVASTDTPLTESTLDESVVTLTLIGGVYEDLWSSTRDVTVSGIDGVTVASWGVDRISDTVITVELDFEGNFDTDATLTLAVEAGALVGYNGPALIATLSVTAGQESIVASTDAPLTESTLDESVVTLTLTGGVYEDLWSSTRDVTVSGIDGVTVASWGVDRISDTVITVELAFEGNIDTEATLTFTVEADALVGYNGPALIATLPVTGSKESVVASTDTPLTESTLDESVVTLTLTGGIYEYWIDDDDVKVSGIDGVTVASWGVDRISDTVITVELDFEGNFDTDATKTVDPSPSPWRPGHS